MLTLNTVYLKKVLLSLEIISQYEQDVDIFVVIQQKNWGIYIRC